MTLQELIEGLAEDLRSFLEAKPTKAFVNTLSGLNKPGSIDIDTHAVGAQQSRQASADRAKRLLPKMIGGVATKPEEKKPGLLSRIFKR